MRYTGFLLVVLLLAPAGAAHADDVQDASTQTAMAVTSNAFELASQCLEQIQTTGPDSTPLDACLRILPDCSFVFVTIHDDPFWLEPEPRPGCVDEWVSFILRLLQP